MTHTPVRLSRRRMLQHGATVLGGVGAATLLGACASLVTRTITPVDGRIQLDISSAPELATPNGALRIHVPSREAPLYIVATGAGTFAALSSICTHRGCVVDIQGARLVCPCHGSTYDRDGRVLQGPAERALDRYRVDKVGNVLTIDLQQRPA